MEEVKKMKSAKTPVEEYLFTLNPNTINMDSQKACVLHTEIDK